MLQRMVDGHFRGFFFRLMDAHFILFLLVDNDAKAQRAAPFVSVPANVSAPDIPECVCLLMHDPTAKKH